MFKRNIKEKLERALKRSPVVLLTGARQTGKTTLIKEIGAQAGYSFITFDDVRSYAFAKNDPAGFIESITKPVILDEVQRVPELFLTIKKDVDEHRISGRYALTGSANPLLIPRLGDSLAGRMEIHELFPLSQGELLGIFDNVIDQLFSDANPVLNPSFSGISKKQLFEKIIVGGYPPVQSLDEEGIQHWFNGYITTTLYRDVQDLAHISGLAELPNLLGLLATRAGNLLNVSEISRGIGIASTTLHRYLTLLETLFLVNFQPSWSGNLGKRFVKSPKLYLGDTGLLCYLLGINLEKMLSDTVMMGAIIENFVVNELLKQSSWCKSRVKLYHYRTSTGIEVDTILEEAGGRIVALEIKSSETVNPADFKGLKELQEKTGSSFVKGIVFYRGNQIFPAGKNLYAVPISWLWQK